MSEISELLVPFGVDAANGQPLPELSEESVRSFLRLPRAPEDRYLKERADDMPNYDAIGEVDANNLSQAGWGIIFGPGVDQSFKDALKPLIDHRKASADPFVVYDGDQTVQPGQTATDWLTDRGVSLQVVDPQLGVPYYLLIVAPPETVSFEFQYTLDIHWAVGRLWFDTADEFRLYAESVVSYESVKVVATSRSLTMFAPVHDFDNATQLFMTNVAKSLSEAPNPVGSRQGFDLNTIFSECATKTAFSDLLNGRSEGGTPSLLFSGSHGMSFLADDDRQCSSQGAVVCQDWPGYGTISEDHWFSASDVSLSAKIHGMVHVFFACHGGGCSDTDNFDRMNGQPKRIAAKPFISKLPQKLLSCPNGGALAVLAHIERAWAYSFTSPRVGSQTQGFRDVIGRLLRGDRIGKATDSFNTRWAGLSVELAEAQRQLSLGVDVSLRALGRMWVARDDARNFVVLGDPAVRIRIEALPPRQA